MIQYKYDAVDKGGRRRRGMGAAASASGLAESLALEGLVLVTATEVTVAEASVSGGRVSRKALLEGFRSVSALLDAGLPLARALEHAESLAAPALRGALADVRARVSRGESFAAALNVHPAVFGPLAPSLVRAGERSGDLPGALRALVLHQERDVDLRERLLSASLYPLVLLVFGGIAVAVLVLLVIPKFGALLTGTGIEPPFTTRVMLGVSTTLRAYWWLLPLGAGALVALGRWATASVNGRSWLSARLASLPLLGTIQRDRFSAQVARLLALLLQGGTPLYQALDETAQALEDPRANAEVIRIRDRVREGSSLHTAVGQLGFFSAELVQLIGVGESSGRLADFVGKAATLLEERSVRSLQRLVTLLEPLMIVGFGGLVGFVALSLLQAIYGINAGALR